MPSLYQTDQVSEAAELAADRLYDRQCDAADAREATPDEAASEYIGFMGSELDGGDALDSLIEDLFDGDDDLRQIVKLLAQGDDIAAGQKLRIKAMHAGYRLAREVA